MRTIELVGYGHPDRFADYISEKILMAHLSKDKNAKVAAEVMVTRNKVFLGGEITSSIKVDYEKLIQEAIERVYGEKWWPNYKEVKVINNILKQSPELNIIQNISGEIVSGDQGVIYGYYSKQRYNDIFLLYEMIDKLRKKFNLSPDWKLLYNRELKELSISVCGALKSEHPSIKIFLEDYLKEQNINVVVNPAGEWLIGGPLSDTGLTGRKLMIDTFGAGIPHGGGAFCGKDFSKVDKSGVLIGSEIAYEYAKKNNISDDIVVELHYKIKDRFPEIIINGNRGMQIGKESLNDWIKRTNVMNIDWSEIVLKGGVLFYLKDKFKF